jgi:uncharacterized cupin superfamily protein
MSERIFNLLALELNDLSGDAPAGHRFRGASPGLALGARKTGLSVYEVEPGHATWPYHFEAVEEEWLIVVSGELTLRTPDGEQRLRAGDVACFPPGPAGAHALRNDGDTVVRFAMPSSVAPYGDGCIYPDSGKAKVAAPGFVHRGWLGDEVPYWEGEE